VRRLFWIALGLGAGAAGAILTTRFARKQMQKVAPSTIAREARGGLLELSKLVSESIEEGKRAMERAEAEARSSPPND
jgi:sensor histidine kinase regulating citrate/malate metabolism